MPDQRNIFIAIALSVAVLLVWTLVFPNRSPLRKQPAASQQTVTTSPAASVPVGTVLLSRDEAIAAAQRVPILTPSVKGSISLTGARIDDLELSKYARTTEANSPPVTLLSPRGTKLAYYAEYSWIPAAGAAIAVPGAETVWALESGTQLTPETPVTLRWTDPQNVTFRLTYAIDANYMVTVTQEVVNQTGVHMQLTPFARIVRQEIPTGPTFMVQHEGFVGYVGEDLRERTWKAILKAGSEPWHSTGGWLGFTDKYWLTALAPPQNETFDAQNATESLPAGNGTTATFQLAARDVTAGTTVKVVSHFFAGAREVHLINAYNDDLAIKKFDLAIDWGTFLWVLTKPLFFLLDTFNKFFRHTLGIEASLGLAILLVTVCVKALFFPLANRSFVTMAKMKKLQPMMKELQERYKDDKVELQKQMMGLYQKEKINPLAGCLPVFIQIPVFFSLYKVIFTTIEMRHAPFFGWVHDLSARDPTQLINLFGILHFHLPDPATLGIFGIFVSILTVGIWPILMGFVMFVQTSLNPAPPDPTQKIIFGLMPVIFTVMLASFPAGLVIYYTWNNLLSITQQYVIMRRMGTPIDLSKQLGIKGAARRVMGLFKGKKPPSDDDKRQISAI